MPLAAGLLTAVQGGLPNPDVWATGGWSGGVQPVGDIERKARAAADFGASTFFIPSDNMPVVAGQTFGGLAIAPLAAGRDYEAALERYLAMMKAEPGPTATFEQYAEYFLNLRVGAEQFYEKRLSGFIADQLRQKMRARCGRTFTHLVTVVSLRPAATLLAADVLQPRRVVLLYTPENKKIADACGEVAEKLKGKNPSVEAVPVPIVDDEKLDQILAELITELNVPPEELVIDLTPGTKWMTLALTIAAPESSYLVYWWHRSMEGNMRVIPGTETPFLWKKGSGFSMETV